MSLLGALIERNEDHRRVWELVGVEPPTGTPPIERADLYPEALPCLQAAKKAGLIVGIAGNQPAEAEAQLTAAGCEVDFIASSTSWGAAKPTPEFFAETIKAAQVDAGEILYVGDRLDNDILPARTMGIRTAFTRRPVVPRPRRSRGNAESFIPQRRGSDFRPCVIR